MKKPSDLTETLRRMTPEDRWRSFLFVLRMLGRAKWLTINDRQETWQTVLRRQVRRAGRSAHSC